MNLFDVLGPLAAIFMVGKLAYGRRRKVRDRPAPPRAVTAIEDLRAGAYVRIVGEIMPGTALLRAPLSERECVHYEASVFGWESTFGPRQLLARERKSIEFFVAHGSARVTVRIADTAISGKLGDFHPTHRNVAPFLSRLRVSPNTSLEATEVGLPPRMMLAACGRVVKEIDDAQVSGGGYREPPMRLVLIATEIALTSPREVAG